jgi:uncharacterized protein (DUF1501 family)
MITKRCGVPSSGMTVTRRDLLTAGGFGLASLALDVGGRRVQADALSAKERSAILLLLVGGPSQLETWDPKPDAPAQVRGPFRSIATRCPGVRISEHFPRLAERMDRLALVRSVHHDSAPIHETGHQLLQTGRICTGGVEHPHFGSVVAALGGDGAVLPSSVLLPRPIAATGVGISHGQSAGWLGRRLDPFVVDGDPSHSAFDSGTVLKRARTFTGGAASAPGSGQNAFDLAGERDQIREAYGRTTLGQSCLLARRLIESGVRVVTVNMFDTVFDRVTWDCHGSAPFSTLADYADSLLPAFDRALAALIDDLEARGRLDSTLVVAAGEFGRTPMINASGGRDHWPGVWSVALAGGGVRGGQVVGASDAQAGSPADRPVTPQDLLATIYHSLAIDPTQYLSQPDGETHALVDHGVPIRELYT